MQDSPRAKSLHQERVESFMFHAGQELPKTPTIPSEEVRLLRAKLILEEALETIDALGFIVEVDQGGGFTTPKESVIIDFIDHGRGCDIQEVVDGCCDIKVVTTGTLSAFGIADISPQKAVDESNLDKFKVTKCPACNEPMEFVVVNDVPYWGCAMARTRPITHDSKLPYRFSAEKFGGYRREDGKWVKPTDWQPPNWEKILAEQGYMEDEPNLGIGHKPKAPVVNDDSIPVGPGDGLRKRDTNDGVYPYTAYQGHQCPGCKAPLSDEAVKRMCLNLTKFSCPECRNSMDVCLKSWTRPVVIAVTD